LACLFFAAVNTAVTHAQFSLQLDGSDPFVPIEDAIGNVFASGTDLVIDVASSANAAAFGVIEFPLSSPGVFDASTAELSIDFTIGNDNTIPNLDILLFDSDVPQPTSFDDIHLYSFSLAGLAANVPQNITSPLIVPGALGTPGTLPTSTFAVGPESDFIVNFDANGGLTQLGIGIPGGFDERYQITVHSITISTVPEPACLALWGMGTALMLVRRRR